MLTIPLKQLSINLEVDTHDDVTQELYLFDFDETLTRSLYLYIYLVHHSTGPFTFRIILVCHVRLSQFFINYESKVNVGPILCEGAMISATVECKDTSMLSKTSIFIIMYYRHISIISGIKLKSCKVDNASTERSVEHFLHFQSYR